MKLSVVGLFILGILAAVSAAVLVASLRSPEPGEQADTQAVVEASKAQVRVLVAAKDLTALTVLGADDLVQREVDEDVAPEDALSDPIQVVGKLLTVPLKAEQAFESTHFADENSSLHIVAALEAGKRAVNVVLSDPMGMESMLYPGSTVDVLASIKVKDPGATQDETLSVTMLQGITVLAVGAKSVVSPNAENEGGDFVLRNGRRPAVTLLVDPEEAELLKLAMHNGSVSLSMRNPMDDSRTSHPGTRVTELSPILKAREEAAVRAALDERLAREREDERNATLMGYELKRAAFDDEREVAKIEIDREKYELEKLKAISELGQHVTPVWQSVVIRGGVAETKTFNQAAKPSDL